MATTTTNDSATATPAYVQICHAIASDLADAGIQLVPQGTVIDGIPGNMGWACFQRVDGGQKIYVERRGRIIHTTLSVDPATPGFVDHNGKAPGKIASYFAADIDLVRAHLVPLFVGNAAPLRAAKAPTRRVTSQPVSGTASQATPVGSLTSEDVQALGQG